MLASLVLGAVNVIFSGHVGVLHPSSGSGVVAAIAPSTHATRLVVLGTDLEQWNPSTSQLRLVGTTLPGLTKGGRAAYAIDIPAGQKWDIVLKDANLTTECDVATCAVKDALNTGTNLALRMKALRSTDYAGNAALADPRSPTDATVRLILKGLKGSLENYTVTSDFDSAKLNCYGSAAEVGDCKVPPDAKMTDRFLWKNDNDVTVTWIKVGGGAAPTLKLRANAEVWLVNSAIESGVLDSASFNGVLMHLRHYYKLLQKEGMKFPLLKQSYESGPVFCPPMAIEY